MRRHLLGILFGAGIFISNLGFAAVHSNAATTNVIPNKINTAMQLNLSADSTKERPTYFACLVIQSKVHPTLPKWTPPIEFTQTYLLNYAQNVPGFNGLGLLKTTAGYLNQHYFRAYHDSDFKKSTPGFIDAFVLWAGYDINCMEINKRLSPNYTGPITLDFAGKTYHLSLAGSGFN